MCLMIFAWHAHPDYPLVLAGNRDEFYARRTRPAAWWGQAVSLLAGQDEEAGGTWFGITRRGRLAALTNVRAPTERNPHAPSRGALVLAALQTPEPVDRWLQRHAHQVRVARYLRATVHVGHGQGVRCSVLLQQCLEDPCVLARDLRHFDAFLDTPWPKVTRAVAVRLLDRQPRADRGLARTDGRPRTCARRRAAFDRRTGGLGTRAFGNPDQGQRLWHSATTIVTVRADGLVSFLERTFDPMDPDHGRTDFRVHDRYRIAHGADQGARSG